MANTIQTIEKWLPGVIDTVFATEAKTAILENGSKYIDVNFKEAGYVKIMNILMDGLSDYYRVNHTGIANTDAYAHDNGNNGTGARDGYKRGSVDAQWELFQLTYDRGRQFLVDNMDDEETAGTIIANLLTEFIRTKVVPEVDAVRFSKICAKCNATLGNYKEETIAANTIIGNFNTAFEWLTEHEVPAEEQVIFVSPAVMTLIKGTTELAHYIVQADFTTEKGITFKLPAYEGRPIIEVPSNRFYTKVITGGNGYYPAADGKVINYLVCDKKAIIPIVKLNKNKIWTPETQDDFDGYKVNLRLYHDVIVPKNKIVGCYCSVSQVAATVKTARLDVAMVEGSVQNAYKITETYTTPAGLLGAGIYTAQADFTVGATIDPDDYTEVVVGQDVVDAVNTKAYFALVDGENTVIAKSAQITLTKKA